MTSEDADNAIDLIQMGRYIIVIAILIMPISMILRILNHEIVFLSENYICLTWFIGLIGLASLWSGVLGLMFCNMPR